MNRFSPGSPLPNMDLKTVQGDTLTIGADSAWTMLMIYRGRHCPRCKPYLSKLDSLRGALADLGVQVIVASADPLDRAKQDLEDFKWGFPLAYDLSLENMRQLNVYISDSLSDAEPGHPFAEPAMFVTNGDGHVQIVSISNAPSTRPDLDVVVDGIMATQKRGLPIRGKAS